MEFPFAFEPRYRRYLQALGVKPENSGVTITDDDVIRVTFGRWKLRVPISNVVGTQITEHYRWFKAIGLRGSLVDRGLTFGTTTRRGVCVEFRDPIRFVLPKFLHHPAMTLTLEDIDGFVEELETRMLG